MSARGSSGKQSQKSESVLSGLGPRTSPLLGSGARPTAGKPAGKQASSPSLTSSGGPPASPSRTTAFIPVATLTLTSKPRASPAPDDARSGDQPSTGQPPPEPAPPPPFVVASPTRGGRHASVVIHSVSSPSAFNVSVSPLNDTVLYSSPSSPPPVAPRPGSSLRTADSSSPLYQSSSTSSLASPSPSVLSSSASLPSLSASMTGSPPVDRPSTPSRPSSSSSSSSSSSARDPAVCATFKKRLFGMPGTVSLCADCGASESDHRAAAARAGGGGGRTGGGSQSKLASVASEYRLSKLLKEKRIEIEPSEFFRILKRYHGAMKQLYAVSRRLWAGLYEQKNVKPSSSVLLMKDQFASANELVAQGMKNTDAMLAAGATAAPSERLLLEFFLSLAASVQDTMFLVGVLKSMAPNCKELYGAVAASLATLCDTMTDVAAVVDTYGLCAANEAHRTALKTFAALAKSLKQQSAQVQIKAAAGKLVSSSARLEFVAASTLLVDSTTELLPVALAAPTRPRPGLARLAMVVGCALSQFATTLKDRVGASDGVSLDNLLQRYRQVSAGLLAALLPAAAADAAAAAARQQLLDAARSLLVVVDEIVAFVHALSKLDQALVIQTGAIPLVDDDRSFAARLVAKLADAVATAVVSGPPKLPPKRAGTKFSDGDAASSSPASSSSSSPPSTPMVLGDDGSIKLASLDQLIEHLTSQTHTDMHFLKTFITTYRSFTTPAILLHKLRCRFRAAAADDDEQGSVVQHRVCNVTKQWVMLQYDDFDESLLASLLDLLDDMARYAQYQSVSTFIGNFVGGRRQSGDGASSSLSLLDVRLEPKIPLSPSQVLFLFDEAEIARQLTLIEFANYAAIKPVEFLDQAWSKPKLRHLSPNILKLINRSTQTSMWIASCVLWQQTLRDRLRLLSRLAKIAQHLLELNNFSCLTAIMAGIDNSAIFRLKHTRDSVPAEQAQFFARLRELISPNGSYSNMRTTLHTIQPPCVPFIGIYLTDLTFIEEGNPNTKDGLINFAKRRSVYRVIEEVQQYQQDAYSFPPVDSIASYFATLPVNNEDDLYQVSLELEPRGSEKSDIA